MSPTSPESRERVQKLQTSLRKHFDIAMNKMDANHRPFADPNPNARFRILHSGMYITGLTDVKMDEMISKVRENDGNKRYREFGNLLDDAEIRPASWRNPSQSDISLDMSRSSGRQQHGSLMEANELESDSSRNSEIFQRKPFELPNHQSPKQERFQESESDLEEQIRQALEGFVYEEEEETPHEPFVESLKPANDHSNSHIKPESPVKLPSHDQENLVLEEESLGSPAPHEEEDTFRESFRPDSDHSAGKIKDESISNDEEETLESDSGQPPPPQEEEEPLSNSFQPTRVHSDDKTLSNEEEETLESDSEQRPLPQEEEEDSFESPRDIPSLHGSSRSLDMEEPLSSSVSGVLPEVSIQPDAEEEEDDSEILFPEIQIIPSNVDADSNQFEEDEEIESVFPAIGIASESSQNSPRLGDSTDLKSVIEAAEQSLRLQQNDMADEAYLDDFSDFLNQATDVSQPSPEIEEPLPADSRDYQSPIMNVTPDFSSSSSHKDDRTELGVDLISPEPSPRSNDPPVGSFYGNGDGDDAAEEDPILDQVMEISSSDSVTELIKPPQTSPTSMAHKCSGSESKGSVVLEAQGECLRRLSNLDSSDVQFDLLQEEESNEQ